MVMASSEKERCYDHPIADHRVLPDELMREILTWLPVKSLMRFKSVSREWRSIILDPSFARAHRGGFRGLLVAEPYFRRLATRREFFCIDVLGGGDDGDGGCKSKPVSHYLSVDHGGRRMRFSAPVNGLICFYDRNYSWLYNLATRESLQLPVSRRKAQACNYHLGFDPVNQLYKVLKICPVYAYYPYHEEDGNFVCNLNCEILILGADSSWRSIDPAPFEIINQGVCLDGVVYWMESDKTPRPSPHLTAFHLGPETFAVIPYPGSSPSYLPQFGPGLALIATSYLGSGREKMRVAEIARYDGGGGGRGEPGPGVWTQHIFNFPKSCTLGSFIQGILPNGKVVILDNACHIYSPVPCYLYDQTKHKFEKFVIRKSASYSLPWPSSYSFPSPFFDGYGYIYYVDENIIPLSSFAAASP